MRRLFSLLLSLAPMCAVAQAPAIIRPTLPRTTVDVTYPTITGRTIRVRAGDNAALQAALDTSLGGDAIVLPDRATFTGPFLLKPHSGSVVVLRSETLPPPGRVTPAVAANFATLIAPTGQPALSTVEGATGWRVVGVAFGIIATSIDNYGIITLGTGTEPTLSAQPTNIILDRVFVDAGDENTSRCVALNGRTQAVIDSHLMNCHGAGRDAQALAGWSGAGPYLLDNNYLEASGEVVIFGGADARVADLTPSDITIRGNVMTRPLSWGGGPWLVKNLFELKHAKYVLLEGNTLANNWINGQAGHAILFQAVSQDCGNPWATIADVTVRGNVIRNSTAGVTLLSRMSNCSYAIQPMARVLFENNRFEAIGTDPITHAGGGRLLQLLSDLADVSFLQNTFVGDGIANAAVFDGPPMTRLTLWNNVFDRSEYGVFGSGTGIGRVALDKFAPGAVVRGNVFAGQQDRLYPERNFFPALVDTTLTSDGARVGASDSIPPVVVAPPVAKMTCEGYPLGFAILSAPKGAVGTRREWTEVTKNGTCLGVTTLASSSRYLAHVRTVTGWRTLPQPFPSRLAAETAVVDAAAK